METCVENVWCVWKERSQYEMMGKQRGYYVKEVAFKYDLRKRWRFLLFEMIGVHFMQMEQCEWKGEGVAAHGSFAGQWAVCCGHSSAMWVNEGLAGSLGVEAGKKGWGQMTCDFRYLIDNTLLPGLMLDLPHRLATHGLSLHETHSLVNKGAQ